jgi:flagellar hook-length control protein FliK
LAAIARQAQDPGSADSKPGNTHALVLASSVSPPGAEPPARFANLVTDLPVAPGQPRFGEEVIQRIQVMVEGGVSQARLRLNPPELGSLEIRIALTEDRATVHFAASHAAARDALEAGLPRLRELLEAAGLALADGQVAGGDSAADERKSGQAPAAMDLPPGHPGPEPAQRANPFRASPPGRIDLYA